jgi:4a-hydroxytetrahydrobiopterin dehydratase
MSSWVERPDVLERDFEFEDFRGALAFVIRVADLAEEANHHPDILMHGWNKVRMSLTSHDRGGVVTGRDHDLARRIDEVVDA